MTESPATTSATIVCSTDGCRSYIRAHAVRRWRELERWAADLTGWTEQNGVLVCPACARRGAST